MANPGWLFKNLKIIFGDLDFCDDRRTPTPHDPILEDVHAIGKTSYNTYEAGIYLESRLKPWRLSMRARAKYMAECAGRCLETHQREQAWRMKLEHELTSRFDHEVNCTTAAPSSGVLSKTLRSRRASRRHSAVVSVVRATNLTTSTTG